MWESLLSLVMYWSRCQGSGTLGPSIIKSLNGAFNISVLSRPDSKSTFPAGVKKITCDFSRASLVESFKGQDAVIDLIAQNSLDERKKVINAAVDAGVQRFIPSEFSGNMENKNNVSVVPLFAERVAVRDYINGKAAANPNFSYTTLSNGPFYDWVHIKISIKIASDE